MEDLHWVDAASADVLRYMARRVETVPLALLLSYRDLEIGPRHPARQLLGDFAALDGLRTLALQPLSVGAVATVVDGTGLDPMRVHQLTGGNPFYVAQVRPEPDRPLPASVRDTVLARIAEVEPDDLEILQLIACSPDRLDDRSCRWSAWTWRTCGGWTDDAAGPDRAGYRVPPRAGPPGGREHHPARRRPRLHQRLLDALEQVEPRDPATLTHHAVAAVTPSGLRLRAGGRRGGGRTARTPRRRRSWSRALPPAQRRAALERAQLLIQLGLQHYVTGRPRTPRRHARASRCGARPGSRREWRRSRLVDGRPRVPVTAGGGTATARRPGLRDRRMADAPATVARVHAAAAMLALLGSDLDRAVACGGSPRPRPETGEEYARRRAG